MNIKYRVGLSFFGFLFSSLTPVFSEIEEKIVGGSEISIKEVPYMLSYMVKNKHVCGAGIIDREWGVTAAHCVEPLGRDAVKVVTVRSGSDTHDKGGVVHNITKITYHEKYDDEIIDYDIAVFKVTPPFEYDETTQPLKLTSYPTSVDLEWGIVAGWGYFLTFDPVISEKLQYVWLPKVNATQCQKDYDRGYEITSHEVCYGLREGGRDACQGDSGGPLANNGTLIGITSWGDGCGKPNTPGVYADAVLLSDWVKKKAGIKN